MLCIKNHLSFIPSLLLPKSNPLRWASIWLLRILELECIKGRSQDRFFLLDTVLPRLDWLCDGEVIFKA